MKPFTVNKQLYDIVTIKANKINQLEEQIKADDKDNAIKQQIRDILYNMNYVEKTLYYSIIKNNVTLKF